MNKVIFGALFLPLIFFNFRAYAWDGFDADSAELVEISPDVIPSEGATVVLTNKEQDSIQDCTVIHVVRNKATIEVVVKLLNGEFHTLVMEGI